MSNVEVDHIGIATESIKHSSVFWECLGFTSSGEEIVEEQGVKIRFLTGKQGSKIELLEPLKEDTPIGKFIRNLRQIWIYISEKRKRQLFLLIALSLVSAFAEIITIGLVVPFLAILTNPQVLMEFVHINNFMK